MSCIADSIVNSVLKQKGWTLDMSFHEIRTGVDFDEIHLYSKQNELAEEKFLNLLVFLGVVILWRDAKANYKYAIDKTKLTGLKEKLQYHASSDASSRRTKYGRWVQEPYIQVLLGTNLPFSRFTFFETCPEHSNISVNTPQRKLIYNACYLEGWAYLLKKNLI